MAIALVGSAGAVSTGTVGASVTPAWDAGANRTAGNLLVMPFATNGTSAIPSNPSGWQLCAAGSVTGVGSGVFYRVATGADTAPTIPGVTSGVISAQLMEFSGTDPNSSSVILNNAGVGNPVSASPMVPAFTNTDPANGCLIVGASAFQTSVAGTMATLTETYNNATAVQTTNKATSTVGHYSFSYGVTTSHATPNSDSIAFTNTNGTGAASSLVTFMPAQPLAYVGSFGTYTTLSGTNANLAAVSATQPGDLMFIGLLVSSTGGTFTTPTGFTAVALTGNPYYGATAAMSTMLWYKVAVAGDNSGSFPLSWSNPGLCHAFLYVLRNVNPKTPVLTWNANQAPSPGTTIFTPLLTLNHPVVDGIFFLSMGMPPSGTGSQSIVFPSFCNLTGGVNTAISSVMSMGWDMGNPSPGNTTVTTAVDYTAFALELLPIGVITSSRSMGSSTVRGTLSVTVTLGSIPVTGVVYSEGFESIPSWATGATLVTGRGAPSPGTHAMSVVGGNTYVYNIPSSGQSPAVAVDFWWEAAGTNNNDTFLQINAPAGTPAVSICINAFRSVVAKVFGSGGLQIASSAATVANNTWHHIQCYLFIDNVVGVIQVSLDGVQFANYSGGSPSDTEPGASNLAATVAFGNSTAFTTHTFDDFVLTSSIQGAGTMGTSSVRGTLLAYYPTISTLVDNFNAGLSAQWTNNAPTHIAATNSRVELTSTTAIGAYTVTSNRPYSLTGDTIWVQNNAGSLTIPSYEFWPIILQSLDGQNQLSWRVQGVDGKIAATYRVAGTLYVQGIPGPYSSITYAYVRLREAAGFIYWEYSANTVSWSAFAIRSNPFTPTSLISGMQAFFQVDTTSTEASTTTAWVDNVNTVTIITPPGVSRGASNVKATLIATPVAKIIMGSSTVRGALTISRVLSGTSTGHSNATGVVRLNNLLMGQGAGHATAAARLTATVTVAGRSKGDALALARVTATINNATGQTQGHTTARATLRITAPQVGISTGQSTVRGQLHLTNILHGRSLAAAPAVLGTAFVQGRQRGFTTGHARVLAKLLAFRPITARGAGTSTVRGTLHITVNLHGPSTGHARGLARQALTRNVIARVAAAATARARLVLTAPMRGRSTGHTTARANLAVNPRLLGFLQGHATARAHLTVVVHVAGRSKGDALTRQHIHIGPPLRVRSTSHANALGALVITVGYHIDLGLPAPWLPGAVPEVEAVIVEGSLADHAILQPGQDRIWAGTTGYTDDVFTTRLGGSTP